MRVASMYVAIAVWLCVLCAGLLYSAKFSYRDLLDRPLMFVQAILILRLIELLLLVVVLLFTILNGEYWLAAIAVAGSFLAPPLVRRHAYKTELRTMAKRQVEGNKMKWDYALGFAKIFLDIEIKQGRRSG